MKYLLTAVADANGDEIEVAKFAAEGDAYTVFSHYRTMRQRLRELAIYKCSGKQRIRLYHHVNESPIVIKTVAS